MSTQDHATSAPAARHRAMLRSPRTGTAPSFWRGAASGAMTLLLIAALLLALAVAVLPRLLGGAGLTVLSGSMEPTYSPGDMVVAVPQETYRIGDVVTFQGSAERRGGHG